LSAVCSLLFSTVAISLVRLILPANEGNVATLDFAKLS